MKRNKFTSYAHENVSLKAMEDCAAQYKDVDMAQLLGADEDNFPFLVRDGGGEYRAVWWNVYSGIMISMNDDAVEEYALIQFLLENAYPRFDSFDEATAYATAHEWPRKSFDDG